MKRFLYSLGLFFAIIFCLALVIILLPTTPSASTSLIYSSIQKDSLLKNTLQPRIIFLGGSNVSYGMNSQLIKDSLHINLIDAAVQAKLGLKYMLDHTELYPQKGDILVLIPEYHQFYGTNAYGSEELLRMVLDVSYSNSKILSVDQLLSISQFLPNYIKSKLRINSYIKELVPLHYRYTAFNKYGDAVAHWSMEKEVYLPTTPSSDEFNENFFSYYLNSIKRLSERGGYGVCNLPGNSGYFIR